MCSARRRRATWPSERVRSSPRRPRRSRRRPRRAPRRRPRRPRRDVGAGRVGVPGTLPRTLPSSPTAGAGARREPRRGRRSTGPDLDRGPGRHEGGAALAGRRAPRAPPGRCAAALEHERRRHVAEQRTPARTRPSSTTRAWRPSGRGRRRRAPRDQQVGPAGPLGGGPQVGPRRRRAPAGRLDGLEARQRAARRLLEELLLVAQREFMTPTRGLARLGAPLGEGHALSSRGSGGSRGPARRPCCAGSPPSRPRT